MRLFFCGMYSLCTRTKVVIHLAIDLITLTNDRQEKKFLPSSSFC